MSSSSSSSCSGGGLGKQPLAIAGRGASERASERPSLFPLPGLRSSRSGPPSWAGDRDLDPSVLLLLLLCARARGWEPGPSRSPPEASPDLLAKGQVGMSRGADVAHHHGGQSELVWPADKGPRPAGLLDFTEDEGVRPDGGGYVEPPSAAAVCLRDAGEATDGMVTPIALGVRETTRCWKQDAGVALRAPKMFWTSWIAGMRL